jgi:CheY-like chemotaxis protein
MLDGGKLTIETDLLYVNEKQVPFFVDAPRGHYVSISITDTGIGMDKEMLTKIYEPFFTTKSHGTGLGLSVVYGIVKQHNGFIDVESQSGQGTSFKVYFPSAEKMDAVVQKEQSSIMTGNETVLIIEDDDEFRKVESAILEKLGYVVCAASDSLEGIELFKAKNGEISLVILDLIMPKMNGWEILSEMRKIRPATPSLFVTGYGLDGAYMKYISEEGIDILQKPFSFDALSQKNERNYQPEQAIDHRGSEGYCPPLYLFVIGILLSFPNAFGVILMPGGDCLRLYSLPSTILRTRSISFFVMGRLTISSTPLSSSI